jgi:uncharacterized glyoxalase superfamily protein PhnB
MRQCVGVPDLPILDQINIVVRDMDATVAFYRLLGVDIADTDPDWQQHHRNAPMDRGVDFELDSQSFVPHCNNGWPIGSTGAVIGFRVVERSTVDELFERLTSAGYAAQQEPYDAFWGARYAIVSDPDGNAVGIMSASDPARRSTPAPPTN